MTATETSLARTGFEALWAEKHERVRGREPSWLVQARENAWTLFAERGFPTRADEDWRSTNVAAIANTAYATPSRSLDAKAVAAACASVAIPGAVRVVLVNGRFESSASDLGAPQHGLTIEALSAVLAAGPETVRGHLASQRSTVNAFSALNAAIFEDGLRLRVSGRVAIGRPIHVIHVTTGPGSFALHPRLVIEVGNGCELDVIESFVGAAGVGTAFTNVVQDIRIDDAATLRHVRVVGEQATAQHVGMTRAAVAKDGRYASVAITRGGALVRHDLHVTLDAPGASCSLDGLYVLSGTQHADQHTTIEHAAPHCSSTELYRGIVDGKSRGVFFGRIIVRHGALKTSAEQENNNLVLSNEALVDSTPQLEIFADDVQCRHGSTIGQLDEAQTYYLRSRGIGADDARRYLTFAFANEVLEKIRVPALRERLARDLAGAEGTLT
jgi:Fe-S cluster assembly protein SufD